MKVERVRPHGDVNQRAFICSSVYRHIIQPTGRLLIRQDAILDGTAPGLTDAEKQALSHEVDFLANKPVSITQANQRWGKQARALFENKGDCQTVKTRLMDALAPQHQGS